MADLRDKLINIVAELQVLIASLPAPEPSPLPTPGATGPICWGAKVSKDFRDSVLWIEGDIKLPANFLMACMSFETGLTFSPSKKNPASSATGLIQFMDATAAGLGTTTAELAKMTAVRQLAYVYRYFQNILKVRGETDFSSYNLEDVYMCILLPSMIGKPLDAKMNWSDKAYAVNKGLDLDKNGEITKREATSKVRALYELGMRPENMA